VAAGGTGGALRVGSSAGLANGPVDADMRAAAAALALSRLRPRPLQKLTLETVYVSGASRDVCQHRLRTLLADVTGVGVLAFVDVDRFGTTTTVTLVADAAAAFRAAVGRGRAATVLRLVPAADPWSPALLGGARRRTLGGGALAADVAAAHCRRCLTAKLQQLPRRGAMSPHVRTSLHARITGMLAAHDGGAAATAAAPAGVAARSPGAAADAVARPAGGVSHPPDLVGTAGVSAAGQPNAGQPRPPIPDAPVSAAEKKTATTVAAEINPRRRRSGKFAAAAGCRRRLFPCPIASGPPAPPTVSEHGGGGGGCHTRRRRADAPIPGGVHDDVDVDVVVGVDVDFLRVVVDVGAGEHDDVNGLVFVCVVDDVVVVVEVVGFSHDDAVGVGAASLASSLTRAGG